MLQKHEFIDKNKLGTQGQLVVMGYLNSLNLTIKTVDVSLEKEYQPKGVDFLWEIKNKKSDLETIIQCESKTDNIMQNTNNFFIETESNSDTHSLGWIYSSEATYIFYLSWQERRLYPLEMEKLTTFLFQKNRIQQYQKKTTSTSRKGKVWYETSGVLVPRQDILNILKCKQIDVQKFYR